MIAKLSSINDALPVRFLFEISATYRHNILPRGRQSGETCVIRGVLLLYVTGKVAAQCYVAWLRLMNLVKTTNHVSS